MLSTKGYPSMLATRDSQADPYVQNGLVSAYKISPYAVAVGNP